MHYEREAMEAAIEEGVVNRVPRKFEVCPRCRGTGGHSSHLGDFTMEEFHEYDEEFRDDYMSGRFDRVCEVCDGVRVIEVFDRKVASKELVDWIDSYIQAAADVDAVHAQEMRYHA